MDTGIISKRYAKALLAYAQEKGEGEKVYEEMKTLSQSFFEVPQLRSALDNPVISTENKRQLITNAAGKNVSQVFTRFIDLVIREKREKYLHNIALVYIDLFRLSKDIFTAHLTTATKVGPKEEEEIRKIIAKKMKGTLEFKTKTDPSIIGGFILGIGTYQMDASIATQLKQVKSQFMEKNRKSI
ncbi:F0F1 ATP synthase subunit delta [Parabacteroides sp. Marseille-P3160]|uniref:F0F1 ATP synthase subunit delta n=1 Tax=Parabacteroides sp. Marseille-P3160 TaxID=1917887 RepID=UPI0009BAED05|nr:F0F1 ATP synthase subunit delta [Parabacteroides sp. Marseille-P3160]